MATHSIAEPFASRPPKPSSLARGEGAIVVLARLAAKTAVKEQPRSEGKHPTRIRAAEIEAMARQYLEDHPELYLNACERACKIGLIEPKDRDVLTWRCWHRQWPELLVTPSWPLIEKLKTEHPGWRQLAY